MSEKLELLKEVVKDLEQFYSGCEFCNEDETTNYALGILTKYKTILRKTQSEVKNV